MSTFTIVVISLAIGLLVSVVAYALYVNHLMGVAFNHRRRALRHLEWAESTGDWRDYHRAEFQFKRAARLYFRAHQYPIARRIAIRSIEMRRLVEKHI
jgi:hypothetical protein